MRRLVRVDKTMIDAVAPVIRIMMLDQDEAALIAYIRSSLIGIIIGLLLLHAILVRIFQLNI